VVRDSNGEFNVSCPVHSQEAETCRAIFQMPTLNSLTNGNYHLEFHLFSVKGKNPISCVGTTYKNLANLNPVIDDSCKLLQRFPAAGIDFSLTHLKT